MESLRGVIFLRGEDRYRDPFGGYETDETGDMAEI